MNQPSPTRAPLGPRSQSGSDDDLSNDGPPPTGVYLYAGQLFASHAPHTITTIVGSCVTVCLYDPILRTGGANHYLLPMCGVSAIASPRFGDFAITELVSRMLGFGSRPRDLQAKIFGGSSIMQVSEQMGEQSLGMKNVAVATQILAAQRIPVIAQDVGGCRGRKLTFRTDVGDAWVRKL